MNKNKRFLLSTFILFLCSLSSMPQSLNKGTFTQKLEFMGIPIYSHIKDYKRVLVEHRFQEIGRDWWEEGDFWKQKHCQVDISRFKDNDFVYRVKVAIPFSNFNSFEDYQQITFKLLYDYCNKYGIYEESIYDMKSHDAKHDYDPDFYAHDHGGDIFYLYSWKLDTGTLEVLYNSKRKWSILIRYLSIEKINRDKESSRFRGQGSSDL